MNEKLKQEELIRVDLILHQLVKLKHISEDLAFYKNIQRNLEDKKLSLENNKENNK